MGEQLDTLPSNEALGDESELSEEILEGEGKITK